MKNTRITLFGLLTCIIAFVVLALLSVTLGDRVPPDVFGKYKEVTAGMSLEAVESRIGKEHFVGIGHSIYLGGCVWQDWPVDDFGIRVFFVDGRVVGKSICRKDHHFIQSDNFGIPEISNKSEVLLTFHSAPPSKRQDIHREKW
jgi:hypothetical protein